VDRDPIAAGFMLGYKLFPSGGGGAATKRAGSMPRGMIGAAEYPPPVSWEPENFVVSHTFFLFQTFKP